MLNWILESDIPRYHFESTPYRMVGVAALYFRCPAWRAKFGRMFQTIDR